MKLKSILFLSLVGAVACFSLGFYLETEREPVAPLSEDVVASVDDFFNVQEWQLMENVSGKKFAKLYRALSQRPDTKVDYKFGLSE